MGDTTISQKLATWAEQGGEASRRLLQQVSTGSTRAIAQLRQQVEGLDLTNIQTVAAQVIEGVQQRAQGRVDVVGGHPSGVKVGQVPENGEIARSMLAAVQIETTDKLHTHAEIRPVHALLKAFYKDDYAEKLSSQVEYAKDSSYEIRGVRDKTHGQIYGVASGWHLGKTGFQIDYLSPIEFPREGAESRDVTAGLAIMRQMANRHHSSGLWVEVDDEMRKHYDAAGFKVIATPHGDDPAQLTMMYLPLTAEAKKRFKDDPTGLWQEHITAWYAANWDSLKGADAAPAREALEKMNAAAAAGRREWIQALPE